MGFGGDAMGSEGPVGMANLRNSNAPQLNQFNSGGGAGNP